MTKEEAILELASDTLAIGTSNSAVLTRNYFRICAPEIYKHVEDYAIQAQANGTSPEMAAKTAAAFVYECLNIAPKICESK